MKTWVDISYTQKPKPGYVYMKHVPSGECRWTKIKEDTPAKPTPIAKKPRGKKK